jgi:Flp pilus assembly protein TadG
MSAPEPSRSPQRPAGSAVLRWDWLVRGRESSSGQALVEFVAVLLPLLFVVVAIVQFGLLFGANVTLTNAAREGARAGTIYIYDQGHTKDWNDGHRCMAILQAATQGFGFLSPSAPNFSVTTTGDSCQTNTGETQVNGDLTVAYCSRVASSSSPCPDGGDSTTICTFDTRESCLVQVTLVYRSDIIVPLIGPVLAKDTNGRFVQRVSATMVVN